MISEQLTEIYQLLWDSFGPQHWWPGETRLEIIIGAILTQNTNWTNVEKAIANLKAADLLDARRLYNLEIQKLAELIRPSGYYNIKARRLKNFLHWFVEEHDGQLSNLESLSTDRFRECLLAIKGIGPETADSILLYAFGRGVFVIDAYTARIVTRHGLVEPCADYEQLQYLFQSSLRSDTKLFNEFHALLVRAGKEFCRTKAKCEDCPLEKLPHTIDIEYF